MKSCRLLVLMLVLGSILVLVGCGGGGGGSAVKEVFTISYNGNGAESGVAPAKQSGDEDSPLSVQANTGNLVKSGYLFDGWNTSADGSGTSYTPGASYKGKNVTLYAKWAAIYNYEIISLGSPAPALDGQQKASGVSCINILSLTARGKILASIVIPEAIDGYQVVAIGAGAFQGCDAVTELSIPNTVTSIEDNAFAGCTGISTLTIPNSVTSIGSGTFSGCTGLNSIVLLTATPPAMGTGALEGCTAVVSVPVEGVDDYKAASGWNTYSASIAGYSTEIYTVTFDGQGATTAPGFTSKEIVPPAVTVGQLPTPPAKTGYNFGGWYKEAGGAGGEFTAGTVVSANITVYAKWDTYNYTVTFNGDGATVDLVPASKIVSSPDTKVDSLPTAPKKDGFYFCGWFTGRNGSGTEFTADTVVAGNITVYAFWSANPTYIVTFDSQGANTLANPTSKSVVSPAVTVGSLPAEPIKTGYLFGGWYTQPNGEGEPFTASTVVNSNRTVYAKWIKVYSISISSMENGNISASIQNNIVVGTEITLTVNPNSGYELATLEVRSNGNLIPTTTVSIGTIYTFIMPGNNTRVNATFRKKTYNINGVGVLSGGTVSYSGFSQMDETITLTIAPQSEYKLSTISITKEGGGSVSLSTYSTGCKYTFIMPTCDVTVNVSFSHFSPSYKNFNELECGDVVLQNGKYVAYSEFINNPASYLSTCGEPAGIVLYRGGGTLGIEGKVYMVGLDEQYMKWAPKGTTGYNLKFSTSYSIGEENWDVIRTADSTGASNASENYPAFNYANNYNAGGIYNNGWFLPSQNEVLMFLNCEVKLGNSMRAINAAGGSATVFKEINEAYIGHYWSSTQDTNANSARYLQSDVYYEGFSSQDKDRTMLVRPIRALDD